MADDIGSTSGSGNQSVNWSGRPTSFYFAGPSLSYYIRFLTHKIQVGQITPS